MPATIDYDIHMNLPLPDDIPPLHHISEAELRQELAVALYASRKITMVQAADLASLTLFDFQALLRDRRVPQHYNESDLDADMLVLRELGSK